MKSPDDDVRVYVLANRNKSVFCYFYIGDKGGYKAIFSGPMDLQYFEYDKSHMNYLTIPQLRHDWNALVELNGYTRYE